jgi:hypothetical protein
MWSRWAVPLLLLLSLRGCVAYEYEHEFWLKVDGGGTVYVTGRPDLWAAFKGLSASADEDALQRRARELFERSGLRVRRVDVTHRRGRAYLFVAASFDDVNALGRTPAFPDLQMQMRSEGERLRLEGTWRRPAAYASATAESDGVMAVRFHLPSKIYEHQNAMDGVERGNIVGWRQDLAAALQGSPLGFGAIMDRRSIFYSTVGLFAAAVALGLALLALMIYIVRRKGQRARASSSG